ncbi:hypothetical protein GCM10023319_24140 [Nocardia iowensis]
MLPHERTAAETTGTPSESTARSNPLAEAAEPGTRGSEDRRVGTGDGDAHLPPREWDPVREWKSKDYSSTKELAESFTEAHGIPLDGFDSPGLVVDRVREYTQAMHDMLVAYPHTEVRRIGVEFLLGPQSEVVLGIESADGRTSPGARMFTESIALNKGLLTQEHAPAGMVRGHAAKAYAEAMVYAGRWRGEAEALPALRRYYEQNIGPSGGSFGDWQREQFDPGSFDRSGRFDVRDALVKSFALVASGKPDVPVGARILHDVLVEQAELWRGHGADNPRVGQVDAPAVREAKAQISARLREDLRLESVELELPGVDLGAVREVDATLRSLVERYPDIEPGSILVLPMPESTYASTRWAIRDGRVITEWIAINERYAVNPELHRKSMIEDAERGFMEGPPDNPIRTDLTHESFHVLQHAAGLRNTPEILKAELEAVTNELLERYDTVRGRVQGKDFHQWLRDELSGYSFDRRGQLNPLEAYAEAGVAMVFHPERATDAQQVLYNRMMRLLAEQTGHAPEVRPEPGERGIQGRESDSVPPEHAEPNRELADWAADDYATTRELLDAFTDNHGIDHKGFDGSPLVLDNVREYVQAMHDMLVAYPEVTVREIAVKRMESDISVLMGIDGEGPNARLLTETIGLRRQLLAAPNLPEGRVYSTAVEAFAEAMVYAGRWRAETAALPELRRYFEENHGPAREPAFTEWLERQFDASCFTDTRALDVREALVQSFAAVEGDRPYPTKGEEVLHEVLVDQAELWHDQGAYNPHVTRAEDPVDLQARVEIGERLREDLGIEPVGLDIPGVRAETVREFDETLRQMMERFPEIDPRQIMIIPMSEEVYAQTAWRQHGDGTITTKWIALNERFAINPELHAREMADAVARKFLVGDAGNPIQTDVTHEAFHALQNAAGLRSTPDELRADREGALRELIAKYDEVRDRAPAKNFEEWLRDELTGYSFDERGVLDMGEAYSEAGVAVVFHGDAATDAQQVLYDRLLRQLAEGPEGPGGRAHHPDESGVRDHASEPGEHRDRAEDQADSVADRSTPETDWDSADYQSAREVGEALAAKHGVTAVGFDNPRLDVRTALEYARAIDRGFAEHPYVDLREVRIAPLELLMPALTEIRVDNGRIYTHSITLNSRYAIRPELLERMWAKRVADGFTVGPADRPVYGLIVHEFGHAVDNAGAHGARNELLYELFHHYRMEFKSDDMGAFMDWVHTQFSKYSFDSDGVLNPVELLPEAYAAVTHNGHAATDGERVAHALLVSEAKAEQERRARGGNSDMDSLTARLDALMKDDPTSGFFPTFPEEGQGGSPEQRMSFDPRSGAGGEPDAPRPGPVERVGGHPTPDEVCQPGRPELEFAWESPNFEFEGQLDAVARGYIADAGGHALTSRVGLVDGERPRAIIIDWEGIGHDNVLTSALDRHPELRDALTRPGAQIHYLSARVDSTDVVRLTYNESSPDTWRAVVESGPWRGAEVTFWQDTDGLWRSVPRDLAPEQIPPARTEPALPADHALREEYYGENDPSRSLMERVEYLTPAEREAYRLVVGPDGRLYQAKDGKLFDSSQVAGADPDSRRVMFVIDESVNLYAETQDAVRRRHHSTFLAGERVAAAGSMEVPSGRLVAMDDGSGHYWPSAESNDRAVRRLVEKDGLVPAEDFQRYDFHRQARTETVFDADRTSGTAIDEARPGEAHGRDGDARPEARADKPAAAGSDSPEVPRRSAAEHPGGLAESGDRPAVDSGAHTAPDPISAWDAKQYRTAPELAAGLAERTGLAVIGFDRAGVDLARLREYAQAVHDVVDAHQLDLRRIDVWDIEKNVETVLGGSGRGPESPLFTEGIILSERLAAAEHLPDGLVYNTVVEALGDAMVYEGRWRAEVSALPELRRYYESNVGPVREPEFTRWLMAEFGTDILERSGTLNVREALVRSFAAVAGTGNTATPGQRVLYDVLVEQADIWHGRSAHSPLVPLVHDPIDQRARAELGARLDKDHSITATGLDIPGVPLDTAREFVATVRDMIARHPEIDLAEIQVGPLPDGTFASSVHDVKDDGSVYTKTITLNERYAINPELHRQRLERLAAEGFMSGPPDNPVRVDITHEAFHAVQYAAGLRDFAEAHVVDYRGAFGELVDKFYEVRGQGNWRNVYEWLAGELSGYSFDKDGMLNLPEAYSEAGVAVVFHPERATDAERVLYDRLLRLVEHRAERGDGAEARPVDPHAENRADSAATPPARRMSPNEQLIRAALVENREQALRAIGELPNRRRQLAEQLLFENKTIKDIAGATGRSPAHLRGERISAFEHVADLLTGAREFSGRPAPNTLIVALEQAHRDKSAALREALDHLSAEQREFYGWHFEEGLTTAQIVERTGKSEAAVWLLRGRTVRKLTDLLAAPAEMGARPAGVSPIRVVEDALQHNRKALVAAIDRLPGAFHDFGTRHFLDGQTVERIAEQTNRSIQTVESLRYQTARRLADRLPGLGEPVGRIATDTTSFTTPQRRTLIDIARAQDPIRVERAISQLADGQRRIVELVVLEGRSIPEAAGEIGRSSGSRPTNGAVREAYRNGLKNLTDMAFPATARAAQAGDARAFALLRELHENKIGEQVAGEVPDRRVAEALTAKTFARAAENIRSIGERRVDHWLQAIAKSVVAEHRFEKFRDTIREAVRVAERPDASSPLARSLAKSTRADIKNAVDLLHGNQRKVVLLRYWGDGKSVADVAAALRTTEHAVRDFERSALHRIAEYLVAEHPPTKPRAGRGVRDWSPRGGRGVVDLSTPPSSRGESGSGAPKQVAFGDPPPPRRAGSPPQNSGTPIHTRAEPVAAPESRSVPQLRWTEFAALTRDSAEVGAKAFERPDGLVARTHVTADGPKNCAPESLSFGRKVTGNSGIRPMAETAEVRARGVSAEEYAAAAGADWHRGGFASLDALATHVRDTGDTVLGAVEFRGATGEVGAHAMVVYRAPDGEVMVHEKIAGVVYEYAYPWGARPADVAGVYGIVFHPDGRAEHPLVDGSESSGAAGADRPESRIGARPGEGEPPGHGPPAAERRWVAKDAADWRELAKVLDDTHGIELKRFGRADLNRVREFAQAVHDLMEAHPQVALRELDIRPTETDAEAVLGFRDEVLSGAPVFTKSIALSEALARDPSLPPGRVYDAVVREFGTALVYTGRWRAEVHALTELRQHYAQTHGRLDEPGFQRWLRGEFEAGSFDRTGALDPRTALVESFVTAKRDPSALTAGQQILHDVLVEQAEKWAGEDPYIVAPEEGVEHIMDRLDIADTLDREFGIEGVGLELPGVSLDTVRQIDTAIREVIALHPDIDVRRVRIAPLANENVFAETRVAYGNGRSQYAPEIVLNERFAVNPELFRQYLAEDVHIGFQTALPDRPVYSAIVHEMIHVVHIGTGFENSAAGVRAAQDAVMNALLDKYSETHPGPVDKAKFTQWLRTELNDYSFHRSDVLNVPEAYADAGAAVIVLGDRASTGQRALYDHLVALTPPSVEPGAVPPARAEPGAVPDGLPTRSNKGAGDAHSPGPQDARLTRFQQSTQAALRHAEKLIESNPHSQALATATRSEIQLALQKMGGSQRKVIVLRFWEGRSTTEIAAAVHLPPEMVEQLQRAAVRELAGHIVTERGTNLPPNERVVVEAQRTDQAALRRAIAQLPGVQRQFAELHYEQGRSLHEVGAEMNRSAPQLALVKSRAVHRLAELLTGVERFSSTEALQRVEAAFRDNRTAAQQAAARLTPDQQRLIELRFDRGLTVEQAAREMGKGTAAVEAQERRAVRKLAELLGARPEAAVTPTDTASSGGRRGVAATDLLTVREAAEQNPDRLRRAIEELPRKQREVAEPRFLRGQSVAEIAEALGRTENSVVGSQRRAVQALATLLSGETLPARPGGADLALVRATHRDRPAEFRRALEQLDYEHRRVIRLRIVKEHTAAEVATAMKKTEDAVNNLQKDAVRRLAEVLRGEERMSLADATALVERTTRQSPEVLRRAIDQLPETERQYARLSMLEGKQIVAISAAMDRTHTAVRSLRRRTMLRLGEIITQETVPDPPTRRINRATSGSGDAEAVARLMETVDLGVAGFDTPGIVGKNMVELGHAILEMRAEYPQLDLHGVAVEQLAGDSLAVPGYSDDLAPGAVYAELIVLSERLATDPNLPEWTVYDAVVLAYGDAMVISGRWRAEVAALPALRQHYAETHGPLQEPAFTRWLEQEFAGCFDAQGAFDPRKALVASFQAVANERYSATPADQVLHRLLIEQAELWHGKDPQDPSLPVEDPARVAERTAIGDALREELGIEHFGLDSPGVHLDIVRDFAAAVRDVRAVYPEIDLRAIRIGPLIEDTFAQTEMGFGRGGKTYTLSVTLNERYAINPELFHNELTDAVTHGHLVGPADRPAYAIVVHEMFHGLHNVSLSVSDLTPEGQRREYTAALGALIEAYGRDRGEVSTDEFHQWLRDGLTSYSFEGNQKLDLSEAYAEAAAAVFLRGDQASEPQRVLHDRLQRLAREAHGGGIAHRMAGPEPEPGARRSALREGRSTLLEGRSALPEEGPPPAQRRWGWGAKSEPPSARDIGQQLERRHGIAAHVFGSAHAAREREFAQAVHDLMAAHPHVPVRGLDIKWQSRDAAALLGVDNNGVVTARIALSYELMHEASAPTGRVYEAVVREFGDAMVFTGRWRAEVHAMPELLRYYSEKLGVTDTSGFHDWLRTQFDAKIFDDSGTLDPRKALQDSFVAVTLDRTAATPGMKVLYDVLVEQSEKWAGKEPHAVAAGERAELVRARTEIAEALRAELGISVSGFDLPLVDLGVAREFADGIRDILALHPDIVVSGIRIEPLDVGEHGIAFTRPMPRMRAPGYESVIVLSERFAINPELLRQYVSEGVRTGFAVALPERPTYSVIVHEMMHALHNARGISSWEVGQVRDSALEALMNKYGETHPGPVDQGAFEAWLVAELTDYSFFRRPADLELLEAYAEAGAAVVLYGDRATDGQRALYEHMTGLGGHENEAKSSSQDRPEEAGPDAQERRINNATGEFGDAEIVATLMEHVGLGVTGFDTPGLVGKNLVEFGHAVLDMRAAHPQLDLRGVAIKELTRDTLALPGFSEELPPGALHTAWLVLNERLATDATLPEGTIYNATVRGFGDAMVIAGRWRAEVEALPALRAHFTETHGPQAESAFRRWLEREFDGYFDAKRDYDPRQALVGAFEAVVNDRSIATPAEQVLHRVLVEQAEIWHGKNPYDPSLPIGVDPSRAADRKAIGDALFEEFGIMHFGLDLPGVHLDMVRQFAAAVRDVQGAYPGIDIGAIRIAPLIDSAFAQTRLHFEPGGKPYSYSITLNERYAINPEYFRNAVAEAVASGHLVGPVDPPAYTMLVHEMFHGLHNVYLSEFDVSVVGARLDNAAAMRDLIEAYGRDRFEVDTAEFHRWLRDGLSSYSFDDRGLLNLPEAYAEAAAAVFLHGDQATEPQRVLHDRLALLAREADASRRAGSIDEPGEGGPSASISRNVAAKPHELEQRQVGEHGPDAEAPREDTGPLPESPWDAGRYATIAELAAALRENHGLEVVGFDTPGLELGRVREYAQAIHDALTAHPEIELRGASILETDRAVQAVIGLEHVELGGALYTEMIVLNAAVAAEAGQPAGPLYHAVLREFGDAMVYAGRWRAEVYAMPALHEHYTAHVGPMTDAAFTRWLTTEFRPGSFDDAGAFHVRRALRESFAAVMGKRADVTAGEQVLHDVLVEQAGRWHRKSVDIAPDPIGDEGAHLDARRALQAGLADARIVGFGFDTPGVSLPVVREFEATLREMLERHPEMAVRLVGFAPLDDGTLGTTRAIVAPDDQVVGTLSITLNERYAINPELYRQTVAEAIARGFLAGLPDQPVRSTIVHESLHAVHNTTGFFVDSASMRADRLAALSALIELYEQQHPAGVPDFSDWLEAQLTGYSFTKDGSLNLKEAYPESGAAVIFHGDRATPAQHLLYERFMRDVREAAERRRRETGTGQADDR